MQLGAWIQPDHIFLSLPGADRPTALKALADGLADKVALGDAEDLYQRLLEREELGSTALGAGVAIPHCKVKDLDDVLVAIGITRKGIDYAAEDGQPVRLLFLVVSPEDKPAEHLRSLSAISKWVKNRSRVEEILELEDVDSIYSLLTEEAS